MVGTSSAAASLFLVCLGSQYAGLVYESFQFIADVVWRYDLLGGLLEASGYEPECPEVCTLPEEWGRLRTLVLEVTMADSYVFEILVGVTCLSYAGCAWCCCR